MATLDTSLSIPTSLSPTPSVPVQSKPAEGFQQVLESETHKADSSVPQPKPATAGSKPAREPLQPVASKDSGKKLQFARDSNDARKAVKPEQVLARAQREATSEAAQKRSSGKESKAEAELVEVEAQSTDGQDLPSELEIQPSVLTTVVNEDEINQTGEDESSGPVAQTPSVAALLASLVVQTAGDIKGTPVAADKPSSEATPLVSTLPVESAASLADAPMQRIEVWTSAAASIAPDVPAETTPVEASVTAKGLAATLPETEKPILPDSQVPSEKTGSTIEKAPTKESVVTEIKASQPETLVTTAQESGPVVPVTAPRVEDKTSKAGSEKFGLPERAAKPAKSQQQAKEENLFEVQMRPKVSNASSLSQTNAETGAGNESHQDASQSSQQEAKAQVSDVHGLRAAINQNKEISRAQSPVHVEPQVAKENAAQPAAEPALLPEIPVSATDSPREGALGLYEKTADTSIISAPEVATSTPSADKVATVHGNVNWTQIEKAQVVSQIVERAHLLGKNQSELMVVLKPEFLGRVNLHAAMVDNQLVATIMAESASVKQMLESQITSLQTVLHEQGLPVAKVEVVQGSQLSFADLGAGQSSSQQHLESAKSQLPLPLTRYETHEESPEITEIETHRYAPATSRSLNLVA